MKLFKYIVLVIIVGLIILRLLYTNAFGNIHLPHVDGLCIIAAVVVILAFFFAFWIMKVEEELRNEKNDIWDALCALKDGHNDNHNVISKLLKANTDSMDIISEYIDKTKELKQAIENCHARLSRLEEQEEAHYE